MIEQEDGEPGRRERKKARTRRAIADAALRLFLERGYDAVSVKEIANAADVAVTTLFKHFPGKEALVFDEDADQEAALVAAVRDRAPGQSVLDALRALFVAGIATHVDVPGFDRFVDLIERTPALREYGHRMWLRHEAALARAIAASTGAGADDLTAVALARFVLEARAVVERRADPARDLTVLLGLLESGFGDYGRADPVRR